MYEWDSVKNADNRTKHGLDFRDAEQVFEGRCVTFHDRRRDYGEERFITLGQLAGRVVVIAHTRRGDNIRVISMRKGNRREQEAYSQRSGPDRRAGG